MLFCIVDSVWGLILRGGFAKSTDKNICFQKQHFKKFYYSRVLKGAHPCFLLLVLSFMFYIVSLVCLKFIMEYGVKNESIFVVLENTALNSLLYQTLSPRILLSDSLIACVIYTQKQLSPFFVAHCSNGFLLLTCVGI